MEFGGKHLYGLKNGLHCRTTTKCFDQWTAVWMGGCYKRHTARICFRSHFVYLDDDVKSDMLKFADDVKLIGSVGSEDDVGRLKMDLNSLGRWAEK